MFLKVSFLLSFLLLSGCNFLGSDSVVEEGFESATSGTPLIKIYSAASGGGSEVTTSTLNDNAAITLYAVKVTSTGVHLSDESVTWSVANSLGTLSTTTGTSTVFTPNAGAGTEVVTATHATLGSDSTGNLSITFTVSNIATLQAWYKADRGVTYNGSNRVSSWSDQSTNSNSAAQAGADSIKPLYISSAINGLPALRFDGVDEFMSTTSSVVSGNSARSIFIVAKNISNTGTYNALLDLTDTVAGDGTNYGITAEVAVRISGNRVFNEGIGAGETKVLTVTNAAGATSAGIETYLNGAQSTQNSITLKTINTLTNPMTIAKAAFGSSFCNCDIAEIVIYNSLVSTVDQQAVELYLRTKYGL